MVTPVTATDEILQQALEGYTHPTPARPTTATLITALQQTERLSKRLEDERHYAQLLGTWQLVFTTTSPTAGRWIPRWVTIELTFSADPLPDLLLPPTLSPEWSGSVSNQVQFGGLTLTLKGPTAFLPPRRILAFDFTHLTLTLLGKVIYRGAVRGGTQQAQKFYALSLKEQAFFRFFWITPQGIAARGKGGGLALWRKKNAD